METELKLSINYVPADAAFVVLAGVVTDGVVCGVATGALTILFVGDPLPLAA